MLVKLTPDEDEKRVMIGQHVVHHEGQSFQKPRKVTFHLKLNK